MTILIGLAIGFVAGCLINDVAHRVERAADHDGWDEWVDAALTVARPSADLRIVGRY